MGFEAVLSDYEYETTGHSVPSGVSEQPMSDEETLLGAHNRAKAAKTAFPEADYWVGIEGGVAATGKQELECFAWVVILGKQGTVGKARTAAFLLPPKVVDLIQQGLELGEANDRVFSQVNSKQHNGASGLLSNNAVTRTTLYFQPVALALAPFLQQELYQS